MEIQKKGRHKSFRYAILLVLLCVLTFFCSTKVYAVRSDSHVDEIEGSTEAKVQDPDTPEDFQFNITTNAGSSSLSASMKMILVLTVLSIAPFIVIMVTSFTRIVVVLHFVRTALGTQTTPPNQVLIGLALFLTLFIMSPVITQINTDCIQPYDAGEITQEEAFNQGLKPLRKFMFEQTNRKDIRLFLEISEKSDDVEVSNED